MRRSSLSKISLAAVAAAVFACVYVLASRPTCACGQNEEMAPPVEAAVSYALDAHAAALQQSAVAIIVNKANTTESLSLGELREYFLAERSHWPTKQKVRVAMAAAGRPERQLVLRLVCNMPREQDFQAYFLRAKFSEQTLEQPREFAATPDVLRFVSNVPGAIGFVRADEVDPSVKVLRVEDLTPGDPGYKLRQ